MSKFDLYENYDDWKGWDSFFNPTLAEERLFRKEFKEIIFSEKFVLDIGFGSGSFLQWAMMQGAHVAGVEVQDNLLKAAIDRGIESYKNLEDVPVERFDIVTLFDVLEHISETEIPPFVEHIFRLCKKGGCVVMRFPNCQSPAGLASQFGDYSHITMLSGPFVGFMLRKVGFNDIVYRDAVQLESASFFKRLVKFLLAPVTFFFEILYRVTWSIGRAPLSSNVIVFARKY